MEIPLAAPDITDEEVSVVAEVLRSGRLSLGRWTAAFEAAVAARVGRRFGVAVNSGTSGLHLLVRGLGLRPGDEVITTSFSFVASSNCLLYEGVRPVFADIEPAHLCLDPEAVSEAITPRTRAILPVDVFGHPAQLDRLRAIAQRHGLLLIEDSCEALGSKLSGVACGNARWCDGAVFAFYANKQITTGEGGVIVTDSEELASACRSMSNQGRGDAGAWLEHVRLGYNYRVDEMSAALGACQIQRLDQLVAARARVVERYRIGLAGLDAVELPAEAPDTTVAWFVFVVRFAAGLDRDKIAAELARNGIQTRPYFSPIHKQPFYIDAGYGGVRLPVTERESERVLALPFHPRLQDAEIDYVCDQVRCAIERAQ